MKTTILIMTAVSVTLWQSTLRAQVASDATTAASGRSQLTEIIVTAEKYDNPIQKVPMSITAISGEQLEALGAKDFLDFARAVPGLGIANAVPGQSTVTLRGISASAGDATVASYLDDVPLSSGSAGNGGALDSTAMGEADPRVFDLNRIEVLRGPQGTLYGASSMGGAIRYIPNTPKFDRFEGNTTLESSDSQRTHSPNYNGSAVLNIPVLPEIAAFRLSAAYGRDAGRLDRISLSGQRSIDTDSDNYVVGRLIGLIQPVEGLSLKPVLSYVRTTIDDLPFFSSTLPQFAKFANIPEPQSDTTRLAALTIQEDFSKLQLISVSAYNSRRLLQTSDFTDGIYGAVASQFAGIDPSLAPLALPFRNSLTVTSSADNERNVLSQELRLRNADAKSRWQWLIGAYYARTRWSDQQAIFAPGWDAVGNQELIPLFGFNPLDTGGQDHLLSGGTHFQSTEYAGFGRLTYKFTEQLSATAGLRHYKDQRSAEEDSSGLFGSGNLPVMKNSEDGNTPYYALNYQYTPNNLLYVSAAEGYRQGGANNLIDDTQPCNAEIAAYNLKTGRGVSSVFGPDTVWSYEVGSKNSLADGRVVANGALYYQKWRNIQTLINLDDYSANGGCGQQFTDNVGSAISKGAELELRAGISQYVTVGVSGSYNRARITSHDANEGLPLPHVPEIAFAFNSEYVQPLTADLHFTGDVDVNFTGNSTRNLIPSTVYYEAGHYTLTNVRFGVGAQRWQAAIFATNLFNSRTILDDYGAPLSALAAATAGVQQYRTQTAPRGRTIGLTTKFSF